MRNTLTIFIGVIAASAITLTLCHFQNRIPDEHIRRADSDAQAIIACARTYKTVTGESPTEDIRKALRGENRQKLKLMPTVPLDPWNRPYETYLSPSRILVSSAGPDGVFAEGDVRESDDLVYSNRL